MEINTIILIVIVLLLFINIFFYYRENSKTDKNYEKLSRLYDVLKVQYDESIQYNSQLLKLIEELMKQIKQ